MTNLKWEDGTPRSRGGPFEILYHVRDMPKANKKRNRKKSDCVSKTLAALRDNTGDRFNTLIPTRAESDRTQAILNRGMA